MTTGTDGTLLIRITRPEGYEDVHPDLVLEDCGVKPEFLPEIVGAVADTDKPRFPPLPEPAAWTTQIKEGRVLFLARVSLNTSGMVGIYTASQLSAARLEGWRMAIQAAAQACDARVMALDGGSNEYRREATASQCAAAIRALPEPEEGK